MNILYIDHYAGSPEMGMEFRPYYLAREWQKRNHKVRIVGGDFSHLRAKQPSVQLDFQKEMIDGIEYQWIKTGQYSGNGIKRAISMLRFTGKMWLNAKKIVREFQPDVVITSSTYPMDSFAGYRIAKKAKAKYIHEAHDLWPLTLTEIGGMSEKHPFVILMAIAERYAYSKSGQVVSLFSHAAEHMLSHGMQNIDKFTVIPNGVAEADWQQQQPIPEKHAKLFEKLHSENKFIVCYTGGHALSNKLDLLLDVAENMQDENIAFVLVGKGVEKEHLENRVREEDLRNVYLLPPVTKTQVPGILGQADVLYIGAAASPLYRFGVSLNKVYDYMMAAKPILYGVQAPNNFIKDAKCGVTFNAEVPQDLIESIRTIESLTEEQRMEMGKRGQEYVLQHFEYGALADNFCGVMDRCPRVGEK